MYSRINLADRSVVGVPCAVPSQLAGLSDGQLADLDAFSDPAPAGFAGQGFWPIVLVTPAYDAGSQVPDGTATLGAPDATTRTVPATANIRPLTSSEIASALSAAQEVKSDALAVACATGILAGYSSSALGSVHAYPAKATDQANMNASVTASLLPGQAADWTTPFWCADAAGAWAMRAHTAAQIQQAGRDGMAAIVAAQVRLSELQAQVAAATSVAAVDAISW